MNKELGVSRGMVATNEQQQQQARKRIINKNKCFSRAFTVSPPAPHLH